MPRTALEVRQTPGGFMSLEDMFRGTGQRFYVHAGTGVDAAGYGSSPDAPVASLDYAIGLCTADKGDTIILMEGHAETTTAIAADVAGVRIIGLGTGRLRPALTATTGASDLLGVSAANVSIENVRLVGAASGVTALLNIAAADFVGERLVFEHGAAPVAAVTVTSAGHRFELTDCQWRGTAAGPDYCILIEGSVDDWKVVRARADYSVSAGLDLAFLQSSFVMRGYQIVDPIIVGFDTLVIDINSSSAAVGDGVLIGGGSVASTGITIANAHDLGGCAVINHFVTDAVVAQGQVIPTATPN